MYWTIKPEIAQTPKYKTFWAWGNLATWSVIIALIVAGILEIAGTGSTFIVGYYVISALLLIGGVFQTIKCCTLATVSKEENMAKYQTAIKWFGVTGFIFIFHLIYNHFGHGVQSPKMNWAWLVPAAVLIWQVLVVMWFLMAERQNQQACLCTNWRM
ncbi:hypothetical protein H7R52_07185 [Weissella confusa]|uniref:Uncharacterized protein n=1 Tax=Weissella confusa TaxID=1583 RepID=A0A923NDH6_WEICO|nr:hypothetical protein [Weissella confusa]